MDIKSLRSMHSQDLSKLSQAAESITQGGSGKRDADERIWKLTPDKAGNASAVIRFLPRTEGDELPWVKIIDHGFQGPTGKWYIEKSLATIDQEDPVSIMNSDLWNNGGEAGKEQARKQKRRTSYYANIVVISDPSNKENNGQVRIFKFGKKIMDKILDKARPTFADEKPVNVFDYWEGADFKLRMKKVEGYPNYDTSVFSDPAPISDDDNEIVLIAKKQAKLSEFLDPSNFKSFNELKLKLTQVLGDGTAADKHSAEDDETVTQSTTAAPVKAKAASVVEAKSSPFESADEEVDQDSAEYFRSLAEE